MSDLLYCRCRQVLFFRCRSKEITETYSWMVACLRGIVPYPASFGHFVPHGALLKKFHGQHESRVVARDPNFISQSRRGTRLALFGCQECGAGAGSEYRNCRSPVLINGALDAARRFAMSTLEEKQG